MLKGTGWGYPNGEPLAFINLDDVNGQRLLIADNRSTEAGFHVATELAQKVIDSIVFTK